MKKYSSKEELVLILPHLSSNDKDVGILPIDVKILHESSLTTTKSGRFLDNSGTPFPSLIVDLMNSYGINRLVIQSRSVSFSSLSYNKQQEDIIFHQYYSDRKNDKNDTTIFPQSLVMGPSGLSIFVSFFDDDGDSINKSENKKKFESFLRALSSTRLLCAPLDSVRIKRHGHFVYTDLPHTLHLPSEPGTLCGDGFQQYKLTVSPCQTHAGFFLDDGGSGELSADDKSINFLLGAHKHQDMNPEKSRDRSVWIDVTMSNLGSDDVIGRIQSGVSYSLSLKPSLFTLSSILQGTKSTEKSSNNDKNTHQFLESCPFTDESKVTTVFPSSSISIENIKNVFSISPYNFDKNFKNTDWTFVSHDLSSLGKVDLSQTWMNLERVTNEDSKHRRNYDVIGINRSVKQYGGVSKTGTFRTQIYNSHTECPVNITSFKDIFPIETVSPVLQSLVIQIRSGNGAGRYHLKEGSHHHISYPFHHNYYDLLQYLDDGSAVVQFTNLQNGIELPPDSSLWISIDYEPVLKPFEEYPADPNRGVNIPPSHVTISVDPSHYCSSLFPFSSFPSNQVRLYSPSVLVVPPVPDMSMPYNVISLTCTLYSLVFGTLMTTLLKKGSQKIKEKYEENKNNGEDNNSNPTWKDKIKKRKKEIFILLIFTCLAVNNFFG